MVLRVTQHHIEFAGDAQDSDLRMTEQFVQVGVSGADYSEKVRMTEQFVQVGVAGADYSEKVRLTEQFVQVAVHNEGRAKTSLLGTIDSVMAGDTIILGHPSGTLDLQYYPGPTSQPGRPDSVVGHTMMVGSPVNQPADIPSDYTGQLGQNISTWGAGFVWGYPANQESGAAQVTGRLGTMNSSLGETMVPGYPSLATAGGPSVFDESAQSIITLTSVANGIQKVSLSASSSFSATQSAVSNIKMTPATTTIVLGVTSRQGLRYVYANNAIAATQIARQSIFYLEAETDIDIDGNWTQDADPGLFEQEVSHTITLTHEARTMLKSAEAVSTLALTQETESNSVGLSATSTLAITQDADWTGPLQQQDVTSDLGATLDHDVVVEQSAYGRNAGNLISPITHEATSSIKNLQANSFIIFTESYARLADTYELAESHTLNLTQDVAYSGKLRYFAESSLSLNSTADNNVKTRHPETLIELTQTADYSFVHRAESVLSMSVEAFQGFVNLWAESVIQLDHIGRPNPREREGQTDIELMHWATSSIKMLEAESTLELDHDINVQRPYYADAESEVQGSLTYWDPDLGDVVTTYFGLEDEATYQLASAHRYATSVISFSQTAQAVLIIVGGTSAAAESTLSLTHEANLSTDEQASNTIELTQEAIAVVGFEAKTEWVPPSVDVEVYDPENDVVNVVTIPDGQYAEFTIERALAAQSIIYVKQAAAYSLQTDTTRCYYTPFVGNSDDPDAPTPPPVTLPAQSFDPSVTRFKMVIPTFGEIDAGATQEDSITLKAPEFGNQEGVAHTRVSIESSGRTLLVFRDPDWPKSYTMNLEWHGLKKSEALALIRFLSDNLGLEIGIQDHEGRCWKGTVVNPDEAVTEDHNDNFSASIRFEDVQRDEV